MKENKKEEVIFLYGNLTATQNQKYWENFFSARKLHKEISAQAEQITKEIVASCSSIDDMNESMNAMETEARKRTPEIIKLSNKMQHSMAVLSQSIMTLGFDNPPYFAEN